MVCRTAAVMLVLGTVGAARLALAAPLVALPATASDAREPLRVEVTGDASCVDADGFFAAVHARTGRVREAAKGGSAGESARLARVRLHRSTGAGAAGGESGSLTLVDTSGHESAPRTVRADTCLEAVNALALIAALSIDPAASVAAAPAKDADEAPPDDGIDAAKLPAEAAAGPVVMAAPASAPPRAMAVARAASSDGMHFVWSVGGGLEGVTAVDGVDPAPDVFVDLASSRARPFAPSFRLAGRYMTGTTGSGDDAARLSWWMAELDGCPLSVSPLRLRACADVQVGAISASPRAAILNERGQPWIAAGALVRAQVLGVGPVFVELDLGLDAAITRQHFVVEPAPLVYQAPVLVGRGGIDVGVRFP